MNHARTDRGVLRLMFLVLAVFALVAAACGGDDDDAASDDGTEEPAAATDDDGGEEPADDGAEEPADDGAEEPADDGAEEPADDGAEEPADDGAEEPPAAGGDAYDFASLAAPSGDPITIGFVNTEGPAGLNFPELEDAAQASVDYLNEHGGMGDRPIDFQVCIADGSPESSQACAQELAGKGAEMVWIGLDLFPDYATYDAAGITVVGIIPLFPADYASSAIYLGGGNVTLAAGNVYVAVEVFGAEKVAIISADNAGANSSEAAVIAALEQAGVEYRSIKGAESETDAGAQGLVREALSDDPDVLISLYGDAGCIGMIRGRAALGSDVPVLAANTCANGAVLEAVGDDAEGWYFVPGGEGPDTPQTQVQREALAPMLGVSPDEVVVSDLGLGSLTPVVVFTVAAAANDLANDGGEVTGASVADHMRTNPDGDLTLFPDGGPLSCGGSELYPNVCIRTLFLGEYSGDGSVTIVPGLEEFDITDYLAG